MAIFRPKMTLDDLKNAIFEFFTKNAVNWYTYYTIQILVNPNFGYTIQILVNFGQFDVDLTPKKSKFDQTEVIYEILTTFSYNIEA